VLLANTVVTEVPVNLCYRKLGYPVYLVSTMKFVNNEEKERPQEVQVPVYSEMNYCQRGGVSGSMGRS
jgi:hypothetical protein